MADNNEYGSIVITDSVTDDSHINENNNEVLGIRSDRYDQENNKNKANQSANGERQDGKEENENKFGLFVRDLSGKLVDDHAKKFFNLLYHLSGKIFRCEEKTGEIKLKSGKSSDSVISSHSVSKSLAKFIEDNCEGNAKQTIIYRVGKDLFYVDFDRYNNGQVDLDDLRFKNTGKYQKALQACAILHFTHERVNTANYEEKLKTPKVLDLEFTGRHAAACIAEASVWNEMNNTSISARYNTNYSEVDPRTEGNNEAMKKSMSIYYSYMKYIYGETVILIILHNPDGRLSFDILNE